MSKKRQAQQKQKKVQRKRPSHTPNNVQETPQEEYHGELPHHASARPLRQTQLLQMQQQHGNAHVQNRLKQTGNFASPFAAPTIQRALSTAEKLEDLAADRFAGNPDLENAYDNNPAMRYGDHNEGVAKVQQALIDLGFAMPITTKKSGSPDGKYGGETKKIVLKFQAKFNLDQDGKVGRETMGKLDALFAKEGPKPKTIVVNDKVLQSILDDIQKLPDVDPGIALDLREVAQALAANPAANVQFLGKLEEMRRTAVEKGGSPKILEAIDVCIRHLTVHIGITTSKEELKSAASDLTEEQRKAAAKAMKPKPATPSGVQPDFQSVLPDGKDYGARVKKHLEDKIARLHQDLVVNKEPADRTPDNLHSWDRLAEIANAAKAEVDTVFGNYKKASALKPKVNLLDQWEDEEATNRRLSAAQKTKKAERLVQYFIQAGGKKMRQINKDHGADIGRKTLSPGESKSEFDILEGIKSELVAVHETTLIEIDRGWEGAQGGGAIFLQRWKQDSDAKTRFFFWDLFQIMIHEYLHLIKHPKYDRYAESFGGGSAQKNTLIEGMDSVLTETVWTNVESRLKSPAIRLKVEGPGLSTQEWNDDLVPDISNRRYASYDEAMNVASIVGMQNVLAAYFLGVMKNWPKPERP